MKKVYPRAILEQINPFLDDSRAIVITGMRRTGKTSLMRYLYNSLLTENKLFLDLENPLNRRDFEEVNYDDILTTFQEKGINLHQKAHIFLDEIQWVKNLPSVVKYLSDHNKIKFFLTGSASFYLKNLFTESLAGRKYIFELYPLTFAEFIQFKQAKYNLHEFNKKQKETTWKTFSPLWREYMQFGSFPEVVLAENSAKKRERLTDIFTAYFQKEIEQFSDYRKNKKIRELIILLSENTSNLLNINRLARDLQVSYQSVEEWLYFLEQTYLIKTIPPFSKSSRIAIRKAKKVYFVDWALAAELAEVSSGQKLENCVHHLLRQKGDLSFYRKKSGAEIDFILDKKIAFEVKRKAVQTDENKLKRLSNELQLDNYYLVSEKFSPLLSVRPPFSLD